MSKEFEAWLLESQHVWVDAKGDSVEIAKAAFTAGRALSRREMKRECRMVAATACEGFATPIYNYGIGILECRARTIEAIEAIPEERVKAE